MTQKQKDKNEALRGQWKQTKENLTENKISEIEAIMKIHGMNFSPIGFQIVYQEMQQQGFDGIPYVDAKTYKGWRENGFQVRKGEKSTLGSITWVGVGKKEATPDNPDGKGGFMFPKSYNLFHRSQVDAIGSPNDKPTKPVRKAPVYDQTTKSFGSEGELACFVNSNISTDKSIETQVSYYQSMRNFHDKEGLERGS